MFVHLKTHSYYSFLQGVASPKALVQAAACDGMESLAMTDFVSMTGAIEFYRACHDFGIRPIIGLEIPVVLPADIAALFARGVSDRESEVVDSPGWAIDPIVFLAEDFVGWRSLCRLSSAVETKATAGNESAVSLDKLAQESAGLICLCGGKRGFVTRSLPRRDQAAAEDYLTRLHELFPGKLYMALENQEPGDIENLSRLAALADNLAIPVAATQDVHYITPEEEKTQRLVTAMRLNRPLIDLPANAPAPPRSHFTTQSEMASRFVDYPVSIEATAEIAERCQLILPLGEHHFPEIPLLAGLTAMDVLRQKANDGASARYGEIKPEIRSRLEHEFRVIEESGYATIFLVMEEIIHFARESSIPFSSRGSAASSLVAHCLGITDPDPLELNLYFERFLNPARSSPPDIDTDLCSRRRDEVIDFVYRRFGEDRVAMVCTINRFRRRSALREVAKVRGLAPKEIKILADQLPRRGWGAPNRVTWEEHPYAEVEERFNSPIYKEIFAEAEAILGIPRHLSVHPGGMVIAPGPITDWVPTQIANKGVVIAQFDLESIEQMGLVKIDLLGIRGLTVLNDVGKAIFESLEKKRSTGNENESSIIGSQVTSSLGVLESIPVEDEQTTETVRNGRTIGCFQIESPGMRATLKEIQASSKDDIMVALALYRPGPLTGGLKDAFIRRHLGQEEIKHLDPALGPLLNDTYGVILYQEQVLRIAHELAGLSLADADLLRRAMSHFDPGMQMETIKEKFVAGAHELSGVPEDVGIRVWDLMAAFAGYGFPKAHAASYAQVAWRSAWCKTHFPGVFMAAVLANWGGYYRQSVYLTEARRMGLSVRPPHVNFAQREFGLRYIDSEPVLFMGLDQVRDLTKRTQLRILQLRPFGSFSDFLTRVDPRRLEAENIVKAGGLVGMGTIPRMLDQLKTGVWRRGQLPLFEMDSTNLSRNSAEATVEDDWSMEEKVAAQESILGTGVDAHPLELASEEIARTGAMTTVEAVSLVGKRVRVAGMRQTWRRGSTNRGERLYVMSLEDLEGMLNVIVYGDVYQRIKGEISGSGPYVVEGVVEIDRRVGEPYLRVEKIWRL